MNDLDKKIVEYLNKIINGKQDYLDFKGTSAKYSTHRYHNYPATMIPQLPNLFINAVNKFQKINKIYDPFMGSGTTLVESRIKGINSVGVDLNPLAVLMSKVKTKIIDKKVLLSEWNKLDKMINETKHQFNMGKKNLEFPTFKNISYWFKDYVIIDLQIIKESIMNISNVDVKNFFLICFSETVRHVSNTRDNEFKMYRIAKNKLDEWNPDVFKYFRKVAKRNISYNNESPKMSGNIQTILGSSMNVPSIKDNSFDMLITSPPYGDSKTTVAYGQFSRTGLQWLDLDEIHSNDVPKLDSRLLGGKVKNKEIKKTGSKKLNNILGQLELIDKKRALEVSQFYEDLFNTLKEIKRVMKSDSYQFWVTSNRTVKGLSLTTNEIITELYHTLGVKKMAEFQRHIPNKRMPSKNSPTNKKGKRSSTMKSENIVMYKTE